MDIPIQDIRRPLSRTRKNGDLTCLTVCICMTLSGSGFVCSAGYSECGLISRVMLSRRPGEGQSSSRVDQRNRPAGTGKELMVLGTPVYFLDVVAVKLLWLNRLTCWRSTERFMDFQAATVMRFGLLIQAPSAVLSKSQTVWQKGPFSRSCTSTVACVRCCRSNMTI